MKYSFYIFLLYTLHEDDLGTFFGLGNVSPMATTVAAVGVLIIRLSKY